MTWLDRLVDAAQRIARALAATDTGLCAGSGEPVPGRRVTDLAACKECGAAVEVTNDGTAWGGAVLADHPAAPPSTPGPTHPPASGPEPQAEDKDIVDRTLLDRMPVVHRWPADNTGRFGLPLDVDAVTPCCGRPTGSLPGDRFTTNPRIITCPGAAR